MRLKLSFIAVALLISACQTVQDQSIPLNEEFKQSADQFTVKRPTWRLSDTVYQQRLQGQKDNYEISGTETGWGKSERSQLWFSESGGYIDGLGIGDKFLRVLFLDLFDMRKKSSRSYLLKSEKDFAFTVNANQSDMVKVRCRLLSMSGHQEVSYQLSGNRSNSTEKTTRFNNFLGCDLQRGNNNWFLTVDTVHNETPLVSLRGGALKIENPLQFTPIKESSYLVNGEWRTVTMNIQKFSGLQFELDKQIIGAISFDGQNPKIWMDEQTPSEQKSLMVAMSYSLLMYDWLDNGWRSGH
jgi:hypothetical protein